jgi:hypothetical protein
MRVVFAWIAALLAAFAVVGCGGGDSASAPTNVVAVPHDSSATISWDMESGVEYWLWIAAAPSVSSDTCANTAGCVIRRGVSSPYLLGGLINGTTYSAVLNGRINGGPGGPDSALVTFTPLAAGSSWSVGTPLGTGNLLGVAYTPATTTSSVNTYVAVGQGGSIFSSSDALTWTATTSNVAANLNAVVFNGSQFVAAGDGGTIVTSTDGSTWTTRASGTASNLYGLSTTGAFVVAVGANGTIVTSTDGGSSWTTQTSGTTGDLYAVAVSTTALFVAVGAHGTLVSSTNGTAWTVGNSQTALDLKSVAWGTSNLLGIFAAVGAAGTLVTSSDGTTWTVQAPIAANAMNSIVFGSQWISVGTAGAIFTSSDGITWQAAVSGTPNDLYSVVFTGTSALTLQIGYVAVGAAGTNLTAF